MEYIRLGDLYSITKGKKVEALEDNNSNVIRYIQIDDLRNNDNIKYCSNNNKYVIANENDLIIAWDGANAGTIGYGLNGAIGSTLAKLSTNSKKIYTPFIGRYMQYQSKSLRDRCTGATIPHIQRSVLEEILIPKYYIDIQKRISMVLDKAQELIDKRKEQIEACDELIKSLFYHMFGDPVKNDKYWTKSEFENGIFELKYGTSQPPEFSDVGIPFIRATNIKNARISEKSMLFISKHEAKKIEKCRLRKGDIIVVRSGANTGDSTFIPEKYENAYGGYDIIIRLNDRLNWYYVISLFNSSYREVIINPLTRRAGQPHLNSQQIKDLEICYPPIELQNEFAQKVEKIEQQKHLLEQSLTELENNFNSLMQRAFKGELF